MKYKIILSIVSLITTAVITLLCWWLCDCPEILQSDADMFLSVLIVITLYYSLKSEFARKED